MQAPSETSPSFDRAGPRVVEGVWRFRWAVLAATLVAALVGWSVSQLQPVRYEAEGEVLISDPRESGVFGDVGARVGSMDRYVRNEAQRMTSSTVAVRVAERLDGAVTPAEVRDRLQAEAAAELDVIAVTAEGPTADEAAVLANTAMNVYEEMVSDDIREQALASVAELEATQEDLQERLAEAESTLADAPDDEVAQSQRDAALEQLTTTQRLSEHISVDAALYGSGVEILEPAVPPASPTSPRTVSNIVLSAALGLGGAAAIAVWRAQALQRAERRHEPAAVLEVPLLGAVPDLGNPSGVDLYPTVSAPESPAAEAFRFATAAIGHTLDADMRTIVVTSAQAGDGKSTTALNLAAAFAQESRQVMLADADVRMQGLSKLTGVPKRPGLTDLSDPAQPLESAVHIWKPTWSLQLPVVSSGGRDVNPAGFFRTARYRTALTRMQDFTDLLIIDAPPVLAAADASAIAGSADAIVLVVTHGTPLHVLADLQERLSFVGTPVLGYIFNRAHDRRGPYGYAYGQGQPLASQWSGAERTPGETAPTASVPRATREPSNSPARALSQRLPEQGSG